ncbi:MAG: polysaccharide pyruvyl transferase family protein [Arachidicoccus sp.]|nr:polysaccharide pyruvyl transferase family protein [Arachidicoccus sp.]
MKILIENSTWNNVGDGWYQYSLYYLFKQIYPQHDIYLGEGPIKRAFRIKKEKLLNNALDLINYQEADLHVFSGPMIKSIFSDYQTAIKKIKARGANYVFISVSGTALSKSEITEIGEFLEKYPPLFFSSRDEETYNNFSPYVKNSYNGMCSAFLVGKTIKTHPFKLEKPFFISSFYMELEPFFSVKKSEVFSIENLEIHHKKKMYGLPFKYSRHLNFSRTHQKEVDNHLIVRTIQNLNTRFNHVNFAVPNSFISFNPLTYLDVTMSSEFVISDRVHACAIGLAMGKPARFLFHTPRAGIFDRLKFNYKNELGLMYPNPEIIDEEYGKLIDQIKKYI